MNNSNYEQYTYYVVWEFSNSNIRQSIISLWRDSFKNIIFILKNFQKKRMFSLLEKVVTSEREKMLNKKRGKAEGETWKEEGFDIVKLSEMMKLTKIMIFKLRIFLQPSVVIAYSRNKINCTVEQMQNLVNFKEFLFLIIFLNFNSSLISKNLMDFRFYCSRSRYEIKTLPSVERVFKQEKLYFFSLKFSVFTCSFKIHKIKWNNFKTHCNGRITIIIREKMMGKCSLASKMKIIRCIAHSILN